MLGLFYLIANSTLECNSSCRVSVLNTMRCKATGSFIAHGIASINVPTGSVLFDGTIVLDECHEIDNGFKN